MSTNTRSVYVPAFACLQSYRRVALSCGDVGMGRISSEEIEAWWMHCIVVCVLAFQFRLRLHDLRARFIDNHCAIAL